MKNYIPTKKLETIIKNKKNNVPWSGRNLKISSFIDDNSLVLDLGCGNKDLLKYIKPKKYIGIDLNDFSDFKINFNEKFVLPALETRDYIVCSGLLEYLYDLDYFFNAIKDKSKIYIFTFWKKHKSIENPFAIEVRFRDKLEKYFTIEKIDNWTSHQIFICKDLKCIK